MARQAAQVLVPTQANPANPGVHNATTVVAVGGDLGHVYLSYDDTKISGVAQLRSAVEAAVRAMTNGATLKANS